MESLNDEHQPAYEDIPDDHFFGHCCRIVGSTVEHWKPYWPQKPFTDWMLDKQFEYAKNMCTEYVIEDMTDDELKLKAHTRLWNGEKDSASEIREWIYAVRWYIQLEIQKRAFQLTEYNLLCGGKTPVVYKDSLDCPMWIEVDEHLYAILESQLGQKHIKQVTCSGCGMKKYCGFDKMSLFICNQCSWFIIVFGSLKDRIKKITYIKGAFELQLQKGYHFDYSGNSGNSGNSGDSQCEEKNNTPNKPLVKSKKEEQQSNNSNWLTDEHGKRRPKLFVKWERSAECARDIVAEETKNSYKTREKIAKLKPHEKEIKFIPILSGDNPYENKILMWSRNTN